MIILPSNKKLVETPFSTNESLIDVNHTECLCIYNVLLTHDRQRKTIP